MTAPMWPFDVQRLIERAVRERPNDVAVQTGSRGRTYGELLERAQRLASALRASGLAPGDRVAILLNNRLEYPEVDLALAIGGLVRVALNVRLNDEELSFIIDDCAARALVTEHDYDEVALQLVESHSLDWIRVGTSESPDSRARSYENVITDAQPLRDSGTADPSRPAWISYTSGTTGRPKGVVLSHRALVHVAFNIMLELGPITGASSILLPQPLSHGAGFFVLPYLAAGGTAHVMASFDPDRALDLGARYGIDTLKVVPAMLADLLETEAPSPFDTIIYGAAPIAPRQLERALDRYGPVMIQIYGQSEAPVTITVLHKHDHARAGPHRASAGRAWRSVHVDVAAPDGAPLPDGELGELTVRGDHIMDGYLNLPDRTDEILRDGRVWTRDMAIRDDQGYFHLRGRKDQMINSGGYNIAPKEVEDVVAQHPAVEECVAVAIPHDRWGETVQVHVQVVDGHGLEADELIDYCRPRLGFRRPRSVVFVENFPRTAYGKIDRDRLATAVEGDELAS